ncbi:MAG: acyltransferase [Flavobacterium sp.]|nr:acyltransferase [Flavobacterium sp.]
MLQSLKLFIKNSNYLNLKNLNLNLFVPGKRDQNSLIIAFGNFKLSKARNAQINIGSGFLFLNKPMRVAEPFFGMIEMGAHSSINVVDTFSIHSGCHIIILNNARLNLGSGYINRNLKIRCYNEISIGNNVAISENVTIWDSDVHSLLGTSSEASQAVTIEDNVWIGNNVTILKGVTIGEGAVIAAGTLVNKNIPKQTLAGGIPAKVLKENIEWK